MPDTARAGGSWSDEVSDVGDLLELATARPAWHADAACRTAPAHVTWFPELGGTQIAARAVCDHCRVRPDCLAWALAQGPDLDGTWGGTTARQRRALRRRPAA